MAATTTSPSGPSGASFTSMLTRNRSCVSNHSPATSMASAFITAAVAGTVRWLGIDAPEVSHGLESAEPFGREAKERLASLVLNRWVRLEMDGPRLDVYNRHLAYVMTEDGQCINAVLVRDGLARVSAREPIARLAELRRAEADAQAARRGMWGGTPSLPARTARVPAMRIRKPDAAAQRPRKGGDATEKHH